MIIVVIFRSEIVNCGINGYFDWQFILHVWLHVLEGCTSHGRHQMAFQEVYIVTVIFDINDNLAGIRCLVENNLII
jgi:hypothetical protein